jgi:hypothetical protein
MDNSHVLIMVSQTLHDVFLPAAHCMFEDLALECGLYLTDLVQSGLEQYRFRIHLAMGIIMATFTVVILTIYLSCRPFHHYWQINPDPGNVCQAAISKPIIWVSFVSNVSTDILLLLIPISMLWRSSLKPLKKIAATLVLSAGVLIVICAILKSIYIIIVSSIFPLSRQCRPKPCLGSIQLF